MKTMNFETFILPVTGGMKIPNIFSLTFTVHELKVETPSLLSMCVHVQYIRFIFTTTQDFASSYYHREHAFLDPHLWPHQSHTYFPSKQRKISLVSRTLSPITTLIHDVSYIPALRRHEMLFARNSCGLPTALSIYLLWPASRTG